MGYNLITLTPDKAVVHYREVFDLEATMAHGDERLKVLRSLLQKEEHNGYTFANYDGRYKYELHVKGNENLFTVLGNVIRGLT